METIKLMFSGDARKDEETCDFLSDDELFEDALSQPIPATGMPPPRCTVQAPSFGQKGLVYIHPPPAKRTKTAMRNRTNSIHKSTYSAIVKELVGDKYNVAADAQSILQEVGERYLVSVFEDAQVLCTLNNRVTVGLPDIRGTVALAAKNFVDKKEILARDVAFQAKPESEDAEDKENVAPST